MNIDTYAILSSVRWIYYWHTDHSEEVNPVKLEKQLTEFVLGGVVKNGESEIPPIFKYISFRQLTA